MRPVSTLLAALALPIALLGARLAAAEPTPAGPPSSAPPPAEPAPYDPLPAEPAPYDPLAYEPAPVKLRPAKPAPLLRADPRLFTAPTALLPPAGAVTASVGLEQSVEYRGDGGVTVGYGLGGLAAIELGLDTEIRTCTTCSEPANPRWLPRAQFRLGARQDAWFRGMPALVLGLKNTFAAPGFGGFSRPRVTEAYVVASREIGRARLHGGAMVIAALFGDLELQPTVRPLAGFEVRPPGWPRSTFVADVAWTTRLELEPEPSDRRGPRLEMMIGGGARYQFFRWANVELGVRFPREEGLANGKVMIRFNGVWELASPDTRRLELR